MTKTNMINHSIMSLTERIMENIDDHTLEEINEIVKKEMGNYYTASRLCFSLENAIYLIYNKAIDLKLK